MNVTRQSVPSDRKGLDRESEADKNSRTIDEKNVTQEAVDRTGLRNGAVLTGCLLLSILLAYLFNNPIGNYIPVMLIAILEWYRSFTKKKRSLYGLCRLLLYITIISLWGVFVISILIKGIALLFGYHHPPIDKVKHLFPYALMFTTFARRKPDMDLEDKRRYIIFVLYDVPAFLLVLIFKLLNNPLNALYSEITTHCYLGCLPIPSDVETLNKIGIKVVVNMCVEYAGPRKTYEKYGIKQLYLPTIDSTAPSLASIEKAVEFMKEAFTNDQKIFVHCKAGMGRSATIVLCHLVANEHMSPEDALKLIKEKRPEVTTAIIDYATVKTFLASLKTQ